MKLLKRTSRNLFMTRVAAISLTVAIMAQMGVSFVTAKSHGISDTVSPLIYFKGSAIDDGIKIEAGESLYARYKFTSPRNELARTEINTILPERLKAQNAMSETVMGVDKDGNLLEVGILIVKADGKVKVSYWDLPGSTESDVVAGKASSLADEADNGNIISESIDSGDEKDTDNKLTSSEVTESDGGENADKGSAVHEGTESDGGENMDVVSALSEGTESVSEQLYSIFQPKSSLLSIAGGTDNTAATPGNTVDPDNIITVEFDVPVIIDTTGLTANEDGSYDVELESGGKTVTVIQLAAPAVSTPSTTAFSNLRSLLYDGKFKDPSVTISKSTLLKNGNVVTGGTIYVSDTLVLRDRFTLSTAQMQSIKANMGSSNPYKIEIPAGLKIKPNTANVSKPMNITIDGVDVQYGTLNIMYDTTGSGIDEAYVVFEGPFWDQGYYNSITNFVGELELECILDMTKLTEGASNTITLNDSSTITITANDTEKHRVAKSSPSYNSATGEVAWQITYTAGRGAVDGPITLEDTFITNTSTLVADNTYQNYVPNTVSVQLNSGTAVAIPDSDPNLKFYNTSGTEIPKATLSSNYANVAKIVYTIPADAYINGVKVFPTISGETVKLNYKTQLTNNVYANTNADNTLGTTIRNHVELNGLPVRPDVSIGTTAVNGSRSIPTSDKQWVSKVGEADPANQRIKWTVTVNTRGTGVTGLTLYDAITKGLTLDTATVVVQGKNSVDSAYTTLTTPTIENVSNLTGTNNPTKINGAALGLSTTASPTVVSMLIPTLAGSPSNYYSTYEITYYTKVDDAYYVGLGGTGSSYTDDFDNTVWVNFTWPNGVVPTNTKAFYAEAVKVGYNAKLLDKAAVKCEYDSAKGYWYILWRVTVNPHGVNIINGTVEDIVGDTNLTTNNQWLSYISGSCTVTEPAGFIGTSRVDESGMPTLKVNVNGIGTSKLVFEYKTKVDEKAFQDNTAKLFQNKATITNADVTYGTYSGQVSDVAPASITPPSKILDKTAVGAYNYDTHEITWKVTINSNKITMKNNATLTDNLKPYLTAKSIEVKDKDSGVVYSLGSDYEVPDIKAHPLVINFNAASGAENLCSKKTLEVTIVTGVDVNANDDFTKLSTVIIQNDVHLDWDDYNGFAGDMDASYPLNITNTMLSKSANSFYNASKNTVGFKVNVNPIELKLSGMKVEDWLPKELMLDINSVTLYEATVVDGNTLTYTPSDARSSFNWSYDYNSSYPVNDKNASPPVKNNLLTVDIPDDGNAYVLIYECFVVDWPTTAGSSTTIRNDVTLTGLPGYTNNNAYASSYAIQFGSWATANMAMQLRADASLKIKKVDSLDTSISLETIAFKLYADGSAGQKVFIAAGTTNANGELTFDNLDPTLTYRLVEDSTSANAIGYDYTTAFVTAENNATVSYALDKYTFSSNILTAGETATVQITNRPISSPYPVVFKKVNDDGELLTGSKFKITETATIYNKPYTDEATSVNGEVKFYNVPVGKTTKTYILEETKSTPHHLIDETKYTLTIDSSGNYTITNPNGDSWSGSNGTSADPLTVVNKYDLASRAIKANVFFRKVNDVLLSRHINGATFKITEDVTKLTKRPADYEPYTATSTSTGNGLVTFKNVPVGLYLLEEIVPAPHYAGNGDKFILTVNRDETFRIADMTGVTLYDSATHSPDDPWLLKNTYDPINPPYPSMDISFNKVRSGSNAGVGGAVFQIDEDISAHPHSKGAHSDTATSTLDGLVTFKEVFVGVYTLKETSAPAGYKKDDTEYTLIVYAGTVAGPTSDDTYVIIDPDGNTVYDSAAAPPGELWRVDNVYSPTSSSSRSSSRDRTTSINTPTIGSSIPHPHKPGHTIVTYDDGKTYIELDEDGNPVGEWSRKKNEDGYRMWTYEEYSSASEDKDIDKDKDKGKGKDKDKHNPNTGDSVMIFLWILSFYTATAMLIALAWMNRKKKRR